jgi:hypothetical protein
MRGELDQLLIPLFLCAFAPLRETTLSEISRKGAKAQRKYEEVVASLGVLGVLGVLGGLKFFLRREFPNQFAEP